MQRKRDVVWSIQVLRGVAALMVVFHHLRGSAPWLFNPIAEWEIGTSGVDIFFIISGFIMLTAARDEAVGEFIRRRIVRVAPLYWLATLVFLALAYFALEAQIAGIGPHHIAMSMLFIPFFNPAYDGAIWPVLVPGWTLNFEMFFYALFAVALLSGRLLPTLSAIILLAVAVGAVVKFDNAMWLTYTSPMLLEFLAGVWLGYAYSRSNLTQCKTLLLVGVIGLLFAFSGILATWKPVVVGVSALFVVAGSLGFESHIQRKPHWLVMLIGNASYSIYLSHMLTLVFVFALWKRLPLEGWPQFLGLVGFGLIACTAVGVAVYWFVEKPMTRWLSGKHTPVFATT
jgi:exopolysaccharide production protein ExoZ